MSPSLFNCYIYSVVTFYHNVPEDSRHQWEDDNIELIKGMLYGKLKQCEPFRQCLTDNVGRRFAEATTDKKWGSGLSPFVTEKTDPSYWPGRDLLGDLLTHMANNMDDLNKMMEEDQILGSKTPPIIIKDWVDLQIPITNEDDNDTAVEDEDDKMSTSSTKEEEENTDTSSERGRSKERIKQIAIRKSRSMSHHIQQVEHLPQSPLPTDSNKVFLKYLDNANEIINPTQKDLSADGKQHEVQKETQDVQGLGGNG